MHSPGTDWADPGWPADIWFALFPGARFLAARVRRRKQTTLTALRRLYLTLVSTPVYLLVILIFLDGDHSDPSLSPGVTGLVVAIVGAACFAGSVAIRGKEIPLDESMVVGAYRAVFFLRFAFAQAAAVFGFVIFFIGGAHLWIYLIGFAWGTLGLLLMAPTKSALDSWDSRRLPSQSRRPLGALFTVDE